MKYYEANLDERDGTKMWFCFQVTLPWRSCKTMLNNKDHRAMEMLCTVLSQVRKCYEVLCMANLDERDGTKMWFCSQVKLC